MRISIIVPVYNVEAYIERCFDSIISQTYSNIECIFIDDCSPDNCNAKICKLIDKYEGPIEFILIRHKKNKGLSGARNTGTNTATGDYIFYLDSDDKMTPEAVERLVEKAKHHVGTDVIQGNTQTHPQPKDDWRNLNNKKFPDVSKNHLWIKNKILEGSSGIPVNAWNKLLRKDFLVENNLYFKEGIIHEDALWIFHVAKSINSISFVNDICVHHYVVDGSIMQSKDTSESYSCNLLIVEDLLNDVENDVNELRYIIRIMLNVSLNFELESIGFELFERYKNALDHIVSKWNKRNFGTVWLLAWCLKRNTTFFRKKTMGRILIKLLNRLVMIQ